MGKRHGKIRQARQNLRDRSRARAGQLFLARPAPWKCTCGHACHVIVYIRAAIAYILAAHTHRRRDHRRRDHRRCGRRRCGRRRCGHRARAAWRRAEEPIRCWCRSPGDDAVAAVVLRCRNSYGLEHRDSVLQLLHLFHRRFDCRLPVFHLPSQFRPCGHELFRREGEALRRRRCFTPIAPCTRAVASAILPDS